jgi:spore maturation protein CgeB
LLGSAYQVSSGKRGIAMRIRGLTMRDARTATWSMRGLTRKANELELELVITVEDLPPEVVRLLSQGGTSVALWFPDHVGNLGPLWMFEAPYRALFFKEPLIVESARDLLGLNAHYLPQCCDPTIHGPVDGPFEPTVAVVGNMYATRVRLLQRLVDDGIPLKLYGGLRSKALAGSPLIELHSGRYLRGREKSLVFRNSAAVLNNMYPAEVMGVNKRLFEAAACGGATVSEFRPTLDQLFEPSEVLAFRSYGELLTQLRDVLADPLGARQMGDRASARAYRDHTYEHRMIELLDVLSA